MSEYPWDAHAAQEIQKFNLDEHFLRHLDWYTKTVRPIWIILCDCQIPNTYLKPDDLYAPLVHLFERTSLLQVYFSSQGLPQTGERGNTKWLSWFTHYVVEQCLTPSKRGKTGNISELSSFQFRDDDEIKKELEIDINERKKIDNKKIKKDLLKKFKKEKRIKVSKN